MTGSRLGTVNERRRRLSSTKTAFRLRKRIVSRSQPLFFLLNSLGSLAVPSKTEIWIGDSHATYICAGGLRSYRKEISAGPQRSVLWLGPILAYAFRATDVLEARLQRRLRPARLGVYVMGEIDCRVHLGFDSNKRSIDWVRRYVAEVLLLTSKLGLQEAVIVGPVPPIGAPQESSQANRELFPTRGSLADRTFATRWLSESLKDECHRSGLRFVDANHALASSTGSMRECYRLDGCHVNWRGARIVRRAVRLSVES